jgi:hypothetical protein
VDLARLDRWGLPLELVAFTWKVCGPFVRFVSVTEPLWSAPNVQGLRTPSSRHWTEMPMRLEYANVAVLRLAKSTGFSFNVASTISWKTATGVKKTSVKKLRHMLHSAPVVQPAGTLPCQLTKRQPGPASR